MQRAQICAAFLILVLAASRPAAAQKRERLESGSSQLAGRVVATKTGTPVRRAVVRVYPPSGIEAAAAMTDANGSFEIKNLKEGRYHLVASKPGYLAGYFGAPGPGRSGRDVVVTAGGTIRDLVISLSSGVAITGRISDEFGDAVVKGRVEVVRVRYRDGQRQLSISGSDVSDDNGEFRVFGLAPGEYYVRARTEPEPGRAAMADGVLVAPTYYPGTANLENAQRVSLPADRDVGPLHFALFAARVGRISGVAIDSRGEPVTEAFISLRPRQPGVESRDDVLRGTRIERDGRFTFAHVGPGDYVVSISAPPRGDRLREFGAAAVSMMGDDLDVQVTTAKGAVATGRLVFEGGTPPDADYRRMLVEVISAPGSEFGSQGIRGLRPDIDWTFQMTDLVGAYDFRLTGLPSGWSLKSVRLNDEEMGAGPITIPGGQEARVDLVLTGRTTEVTGAVTDAAGNTVTAYSIVVFSADERTWQPRSRTVRNGLVAGDGSFRIAQLPPGEYKALACDLVDEGELTNPDVLRQLASQATSFTLSAGQRQALSLKLVEWVR